ncbi:MAG: hypothetical protein AMJ70_00325 [Dehalococcoidia bacterium SG8_51_3]|nr:MAG: hypothetical protein AMJ70_00325 [Dehalococcoidia bacterium SG8_51_3]
MAKADLAAFPMIIEFIGCTGAGKSTLIAKVQCKLTKSVEVTTSFNLVATLLGLSGVSHPTARNLIQEVIGFPFFIGALHRDKAFVAYTLRMLARQANFTIFTINNLRSLERKIGVYEIIRRYERDRIILVDEGTVHLAHNVFVYNSENYSLEEISEFVGLVPLPDIIVYVRAPIDNLIERSLQRADPPREIKSKDRVQIEEYVKRAVGMFEQLVKTKKIRDRVLIVENPNFSDEGHERMADHIAESILSYQPLGKLVSRQIVAYSNRTESKPRVN